MRSIEPGISRSRVRARARPGMTRFRASLPHPVAAVVFLPAGQPAVAKLQEQPVVVVDQAAAAEVAEREIDLVAGRAGDILQRLPERGRHLLDVHAEHQGPAVRQIGVKRRTPVQRGALPGGRSARKGEGCEQQSRCGEMLDHHASIYAAMAFGNPSRNGSTASMKACGWSILTAWPAAGITTFRAPGIFAAM